MKKMDQKIIQMKEMDLLLCPKCREELHVEEKSLKCKNRHTYDVSKKGTVNFVLGYGEENYNLAMLEARERVMGEGFFEEILTALAEESMRISCFWKRKGMSSEFLMQAVETEVTWPCWERR